MIIVRLIGGLGNQLFQYSFGRHLSILRDTILKLDTSTFEQYRLHKYSLDSFNINAIFATTKEVEHLCGPTGRGLRRKAFHLGQRLRPTNRRSVMTQPRGPSFNPSCLDTGRDVYLDGYWQSEKYFSDIATVIQDDLRVNVPVKGKTAQVADQIARTESVSVHIRRADYVTDQKVAKTFGALKLSYYEASALSAAKHLSNPHFFVFSDEPDWAATNLKLDFPTTFVNHNGPDKNYEDLHLMSMCQHNIIANSSFSWWGGWLNPNPKKIVFAPKKWFNDPRIDTTDLIPESWIQI